MEDLKQIWQQYDEKLQETQALNRKLLEKLGRRSSRDRIGQLRDVESFGLTLVVLFLAFMIYRVDTARQAPAVAVSYWLIVVQLLAWTGWGVYKLRLIHSLDAGRLPVTEMLRRVSRLRLLIFRERLWGGIAALVFFVVPAVIIQTYWTSGSLAFLSSWRYLVMQAGVVVIIGLPCGLWLYRRYYVTPIDDIIESLREIEAFAREDA